MFTHQYVCFLRTGKWNTSKNMSRGKSWSDVFFVSPTVPRPGDSPLRTRFVAGRSSELVSMSCTTEAIMPSWCTWIWAFRFYLLTVGRVAAGAKLACEWKDNKSI